MSPAQVSLERSFLSSLVALDAAEAKRAIEAIDKFIDDPGRTGLNLEALKGNRSIMTIRASKSLRIALHRRGDTYVALFAGQHDAVYERIQRGRFLVSPSTKRVGFVEADSDYAEFAPLEPPCDNELGLPSPFDHWADSQLSSAGLTSDEITTVRAITLEEQLLSLLDDGWQEDRLELALELLEYDFATWAVKSLLEPDELIAEKRLRNAIADYGAVAGLSQLLSGDELARLSAAPIEVWMLFLHPEQQGVVDRKFSGPSRVRGGAGNGKTVVLLHRAASLARRYHQRGDAPSVLVTTYVSSLTLVLEELYTRLPTAVAGAVAFTNVDKLALGICRDAGEPLFVKTAAVDAAFAAAWKTIVTPGSAIDRSSLSRGYIKEEVTSVIKGRSLVSLDDYLNVRRVGRRTQLSGALRKQVWSLMIAWNQQMEQRGTVDFPDVLKKALDLTTSAGVPRFRCALVDEAQDLTLVGLNLIRSLVNGMGGDPPDGLFISGDGAQRIYPGGFTLRQAEVEVRGRTTVLKRNYRNTEEILTVAKLITGSELVEDLDEEYRRSDEETGSDRSGRAVEVVAAASSNLEIPSVMKHLETMVLEDPGLELGDIAILCSSNRAVDRVRRELTSLGIGSQDLKSYEGRSSDTPKVGTYHRSKGLEFKIVVLPHLTLGEFPMCSPEGTDPFEQEEFESRQLSALFVAMTRARDHVVMSCVQTPSELLAPAFDRLAIVPGFS